MTPACGECGGLMKAQDGGPLYFCPRCPGCICFHFEEADRLPHPRD